MKNSVSKLVIGMLITSFVMPEMVMSSRVKGRRRSAGTGSNRAASTGSGTATAITGLGTTGAMAVSAEQNKDIVISKDEYKLPENKVKYLNTLSTNVYQAKEKALQQCNGISGAVSKIFALSTTSAVASGLGTAAAGTALVSGIIKSNKQNVAYALQDNGEMIEKEELARKDLSDERRQKLKDYEDNFYKYRKILQKKIDRYYALGKKSIFTKEETEEFNNLALELSEDGELNKNYLAARASLEEYRDSIGLGKEEDNSKVNTNQEQVDKNLKTATTLGHVRTGMMAGATATSAISMGTSIGATIDAGKLAEKMDNCNKAIAELNKANGLLKAEIANAKEVLEQKLGDAYEEKKPSYMKQAENMNKNVAGIIGGCKKFETKDIKYVENLMTASSWISGIGTATALTGAITSGLANTQKAKGDRKYEKNMDITANVMAGITTGTSLTSTGLSSAAAVATGKKLQNQAKECENALANNLLADVSKEVNAITKSQQERDAERQANIEKLRKEGKI